MALTFKKVSNRTVGNASQAVYDITFDSSYTTGGYVVTNANLGFRSTAVIENVLGGRGNITTTYYDVQFNPSSNKLQAVSGAAEVASTTDLHLLTVRVTATAK